MADLETVRTIFKTEWIGGGVVQNMIRQYGLAEKAIKSVQGTSAAGMNLKGGVDIKALANAKRFQAVNDQLIKSVNKGTVSFEQAQAASNRLGKHLGIVTEATGVMGTGISGLTVGLGALAAGIAAVVLGFKALYPVLEEGAKVRQLDQSFRLLNATMAQQPGLLRDMKEASRGTLTTMAAQEGFMTLAAGASKEMTAALADAAPKLLEISKAANKLNPALGDTNFMFTSLAKGVKRAEPRLIDNLGLKLRVADGNRELAKTLGKTVLELTAEEKQLAILNETLRAGDLLIDQVGGNVDGLGDSFQRLSTASQEAGDSFKSVLSQMLEISGITGFFAENLNAMGNVNRAFVQINDAFEKGLITKDQQKAMMDGLANPSSAQNIMDAIELLEIRNEKIKEWHKLNAMEPNRPYVLPQEQLVGGQRSEFSEYVPQETAQEARINIKDGILAQAQAQHEARLIQNEALTKSNEDLNKNKEVALQWVADVKKAAQEATEAWLEYRAGIGDLAEKHLEADKDASFFTTSVEALGDGFARTGGLTKEQREEMERLEGKLASAKRKLDDVNAGIGQFGRKEEAVAKTAGRYAQDIDILTAKLEEYKNVQGDLVATHQEAKWNWDNINTAFYDMAKGADLAADDFLNLALALGETDQASAEGALMGAALEKGMTDALQDVKLGKISIEEAQNSVKELALWLGEQDMSIYLRPRLLENEMSEEELALLDPAWQMQEAREIAINATRDEGSELAWAQLFGEESIPPLDIAAGLKTEQLTGDLQLWVEQEGRVEIVANLSVEGDVELPDPSSSHFIRRHAGGGNAMANVPILVGEEGPEIITPGSNSTVHNKGGGGAVINLTMNVSGNVDNDFASVVEDTLMEAMQRVGLV